MNSSITVNDRSSVLITGVKSVESIKDTEILIYTELGDLLIRGKDLESDEFDPVNGIYRVRGYVVSFGYLTEKKHLPDNIVSKLFR